MHTSAKPINTIYCHGLELFVVCEALGVKPEAII